MWHAASTLDRGEDASRYAMVAKIWTGEAGSRIANASQHLHGGAGVDRDYPLHRYFLWSKSLELTFGAAMPQLARLGRDMARTGPQELL
jgi:acyl-CoA dehydrogenase